MNLDKVKQNTTWNDASASINSNFMKVRQAILSITQGGGGSANIDVDTTMSDTSENAVANKVIKKYVDERAEQAYGQANEYTDEEIEHIEGVLNARIDSLEGGNVYNVYYTENNELSEEQLEANKKAYAALMSEEKAAFYLVQEGNVYSRLIVSTTMKSASIEAIAVEAHVILPVGNKTMLGTTAINLYSDGHISMTVVQSNLPTEDEVNAALEQKQDVLVSGTTIKTINGQSILGEGDIEIQGGGNVEVDAELSETSENAVSNKAVTMALAETEEVTAAALNELNERFEEYATKEDIDATLAEMDNEINHIEGVLEATIIEDEEVTAAALNDLDKRVTNLEQNGGGGGGGDIYNVSFTIDPSTMELVMTYDVQPTFDFTLDENGNLIAII